MDPEPYDVLAVELSSFQLHWTSLDAGRVGGGAQRRRGPPRLVRRPGAACAGYAADKGRIYAGVERACVYNVADPVTEQLVRDADVAEGARAIGFTLGTPAVGMLGVVDDVLADRAFVEDRQTTAAELCTLDDLATTAPHYVANALAAAALARSHGVSAGARSGRRCARSGPTGTGSPRSAVLDDVTWIDDSKATNPHAALASLRAYDPVVWVAGGLAKGASFDDLVRRGARPAARRRAPRAGRAGDPRGAFATRARCARDRSGGRGDCRGWTHGPRRRRGSDAGTPGRHRAAGSGMRVHGHVRQLRRTRRRLRRGRAPEAGGPSRRRGQRHERRGGPVSVTSETPADRASAARSPAAGQAAGLRPVATAAPHDGAPAHVLLPAARRLHDAAGDRPDDGAQRLERLLLPGPRQQLLHLPQAAHLGGDRPPGRLARQPDEPPGAADAGLAGRARRRRAARCSPRPASASRSTATATGSRSGR